jgi:hypothetical protein
MAWCHFSGMVRHDLHAICLGTTHFVLVFRYIVAMRERFRGSVVIEVGAGAGLCGLLVGQFASEVRRSCSTFPLWWAVIWSVETVPSMQVVLTDGVDEVVALLEQNVAKYSEGYAAKISVAKLEWGVPESHAAVVAARGGQFPIVIGADVVFAFFPDSIALLFEAVQVHVCGSHSTYKAKYCSFPRRIFCTQKACSSRVSSFETPCTKNRRKLPLRKRGF